MDGLKTFRLRKGYKTQMALAKKLGIVTNNVSEWEMGKGYPSFKILQKLFEMGATVEELFGVPYKQAIPVADSASDKIKELESRVESLEASRSREPAAAGCLG